jgi:TolB protein
MRLAALCLALGLAGCAGAPGDFQVAGEAALFAPGIASTPWSDLRLTLSPDGRTALWFSRDRPGGPGGYDIWLSRRLADGWQPAQPALFNSAARDFDPAFSADGRFVYFCSDRPGGVGGDDIYRVRVHAHGFGEPELLGPAVNSAGNEWAPMLSADGRMLLFSSNGRPGARRLDLFASRVIDGAFAAATALPGEVNTEADEFDATYLADGSSIVFARARDVAADPVSLYHAGLRAGRYGKASALSDVVNTPDSDTYAPMLDWSRRDRLTFTTRRPAGSRNGMDVYLVRYR